MGAEVFRLFGTIGVDNKQALSAIDETASKAKDSGGKIKKMGDKFQAAGKKMQSVGKGLTAKVSAPIIAMGGFAVKSAMDFESGMSKVQSLSGATGADLQMLEDKAREMGKSTVFSATEAAEGLEYLALAGWDTEQMSAGLEPALLLAGAAGLELGESADIMTDTMSMFGMEAEEATKMTDMLAYAQANSNTDVRGLGEALKYAGAGANAMGYDLADTSALLGTFADQGLKGSAAGTTLNAMFTDMKKNSKDGAIQIGKTNVAIVDSNGNYRDMADIMTDTEKATEGMTDAQKDQALSSVFGTQAIKGVNMVMEAGTDTLKDFEKGIRGSDGASKDMYETMNDNLQGAFENMKSALSEAAISMGDVLVPAIQKGAEWITNVTEKFNALDDETKENIVKWGLVAAAIGPVVFVLGKVIGIATALGGAITGLTALLGGAGLAASLTALGPLAVGGVAIAGLAGIVFAGKKLYDHFKEKTNPEIDVFGDKVSKNTKEAVGSFMDMTEEANKELKLLAWGHETVTAEMAQDMKEKQEEITNTLITAIDKRHKQEREETIEHFANLEMLDDEVQERILEKQDKHYENRKDHTQKSHEQIIEIQDRASQEGRKITKEEAAQIERLREGMTDTAIRVMSENEAEQKIIYDRIKSNSTRISAEEAAEVVNTSKKKRDEVIAEAEGQHDETVNWAYRQWKEHGTMSEEEYKDVVAASEKQKKERIDDAEWTHKGVVSEANKQHKEHIRIADDGSAKVLSKSELMRKGVVEKARDMRVNAGKWFNELDASIGTSMSNMRLSVWRAGVRMETSFANSWNSMVSSVENGINSIVRGLNWLLDKLGSTKKIGRVSLKRRALPNARAGSDDRIYAKGTDGHPGGPAMVNDQLGGTYREAVISPDGQITIPEGRNVIYSDMEKGTQVIPAGQTKKMFKYAKGTGVLANIWGGIKNFGSKIGAGISNVWDYVTEPSKIVNKIIDSIGLTKGMVGYSLDIMKGLGSLAKKEAVGWAKRQFTKYEDNNPENQGFDESTGEVKTGGIGFGRAFRKSSGFGYRGHPIFGGRRFHAGVDLAAPSGTPVYSQTGGMVTMAGWGGGYGNLVKVRSGALERLYAHLSSIAVKRGMNINAGRMVGRVGSTGNSTGPHLHYEVRRNGKPIHPGYEYGGWIDRDHLARIGEGDKLEAVIPMTKPNIAKNMVNQASDMLGMNDDEQVIELLELILEELENGMSVYFDGRNVTKLLAPYMDNQLQKNNNESKIGRGVLV